MTDEALSVRVAILRHGRKKTRRYGKHESFITRLEKDDAVAYVDKSFTRVAFQGTPIS